MISLALHPAWAPLAGALLVLFVATRARALILYGAPLLALVLLFTPTYGEGAMLAQVGLALRPLQLDATSQIFALLACLVSLLLAIHGGAAESRRQSASLLALIGGALLAMLAGDFVSFVGGAQLSMLAGAAMLAGAEDESAKRQGARILGWSAASGAAFLAGAAFVTAQTGQPFLARIALWSPGGLALGLGFAILAALFPFHLWLRGATARATGAEAIALLCVTPMIGVYGMMRIFSGEPTLVWLGLGAAALASIYALAERDPAHAVERAASSASGLAIAAAGVGSPTAYGAAAAFALTCGLGLFLLAIAAAETRDRLLGSDEPNAPPAWKAMPWTTLGALAGALALAGAPPLAGFPAHLLLSEAFAQTRNLPLHVAFAALLGAFMAHAGVRTLGLLAWQRGRPGPPRLAGPQQALLAGAALLAVFGLAPGFFYALLPPATLAPAEPTLERILRQLQPAAFAALSLAAAWGLGWFPNQRRPAPLDVDEALEAPMARLATLAREAVSSLAEGWRAGERHALATLSAFSARALRALDQPGHVLARQGIAILVLWATLLYLVRILAR